MFMARRHPGRSEKAKRLHKPIVPQPEVEFTLNIDLRCKGLTDAQVAFLEHVAYNAAHTSVSKEVKLLVDRRNVPRP